MMEKTTRSSVRSRLVIWGVMLFGGAAAGITLDTIWFSQWLVNPWWHLISMAAGLIVLKFVFTSSRTTGRFLAQHGKDGEVPRFETNKLVTSGPYSCMRHPMHFGLLFMPLALALLLGSVSFILLIAPAEMIFMWVMIMVFEEREAIEKFGDDYLQYRKHTPAFSAAPPCLKKLLGITN